MLAGQPFRTDREASPSRSMDVLGNKSLMRHPRELGTPEERSVTPVEALAFVRTHGLVLESGTGPVPSLAEAVAGGPIRGSWWGHARAREIFTVTRAVRDCPDVLVCRLVDGKITYVHRRLWPAVVRLAKRFPSTHISQIHEVHTGSGKHVAEEIRFPAWVSREVMAEASCLDEERALAQLKPWSGRASSGAKSARRKKQTS
jgi:hypothetical protein